jgi:16S rRNA (adenine1518-N6/adenine1519-N6)-dimethyltransferase
MGVRREARDALAAAGLRPRKRWGQHFLCDPGVARRIVEAALPEAGATVLEIGPGLGALTDGLAAQAAMLYLVEVDRGLAGRLAARYAEDPHVRVLLGDVLELPLTELVAAPRATVVANLPYNIASPVLFRLLELRTRFPRAVLMLQREMAERLAARPREDAYGSASVVVQAFAEVRIAFRVSRRSFLPRPAVDSAVVAIDWRETSRPDVGDEAVFRAVVRAAFGQRRKMLRNALASLAAQYGTTAEALLARAGVDPTARAETLDLEAFARLAHAVEA